MAVIVVGLIAITLLGVALAISHPTMFAIGAIPSTLALVIGLSCYMWLDQWEPEPPKLLLYAFVWGGGISVIGTLFFTSTLTTSGLIPNSSFFGTVIGAPFIEELMKGSFLFFMLAGVRRREMRTLVDHLVYAGFVGFGFAFVENLLYFSSAATLEETVFMAVVRTGFNMFGHAFYTSATAVGIYLGRKQVGSMRAVHFVCGYLVAVALHAAWNGAATVLGIVGLIAVYLLVLTPAFITLLVHGVKSRRREGEVLAAQLPRMVAEGLISPDEATWMACLKSRTALRKQLKAQQATVQLSGLSGLVDAVTELAIIRDRTLGEPSQFQAREEEYLVRSIIGLHQQQNSAATSFVHQQAQAHPGGVGPMPPRPYPNF